MTDCSSKLFEPIQLGPLCLTNRMVMAPMSRNRADDADAPHRLTAEYYAQRATAGLIITEASPIEPGARTSLRAPGIYTSRQVEGWRQVVEGVHRASGKIFLQLWHAGRISHRSVQPDDRAPLAPSPIAPNGTVNSGVGTFPFEIPRTASGEDISAVVAQFAGAARNAHQAGFDGVEIHAANGYLIDEFLRDGSNHRIDAYGGSIENRSRFLTDIVDAVAAIWGKDRVGVRLSPASSLNSMSDSDPQGSFGFIANKLGDMEIAFLHVDETADHASFDWRSFRASYKGIYVANSGYDYERATTAIESDYANLVSFGRLFLANPDLVERFRRGAPLNDPDRSTFYGGDHHGYTDYPSLTSGTRTDR
jgi:N-ethylmaleimide reductase